MTEQEFVTALARSLYWGYLKDTTGTPGKWSDLDQDQRKVWRRMAQRARRRIQELTVAEQVEMPG
jgi:hypothetical protein